MNPKSTTPPSKRPAARRSAAPPELGFRHWMQRVLEEAKLAEQGFDPDPVHDLRVALRRCRSMADGFRAIDPDPAWKAMKRAGGRVFRSLGDLRDVQVMRDWVRKLAPPEDRLQPLLDEALAARETVLKREAQESLSHLDHDEWRTWSEHLAARAARVRLDSPVFQYVALERWHEAHELHRQALRNRSQAAWHSLRVGIKRLRYTAENFLPDRHERWGKDLKLLQDALGEVHDLDVLWEQIRTHAFEDREAVARWRARIAEERGRRIDAYRKRMVGPASLWQVWRRELPQGAEQHRALLTRAQTLVSLSGASVSHARHVLRLALQVHDGLQKAAIFEEDAPSARKALELAAMLQDVGRFRAGRGHHKHSYRMLGRMAAPLDWPECTWDLVAGLTRYHRGALPEAGHEELSNVPAGQRKLFLQLAAVLRLANALDAGHEGTVRSIKVVRTPETIQLHAAGFVHDPDAAPAIAIAKYLLETACGLPVALRGGVAKSNVVIMQPPKRTTRSRGSPIGKHHAALS
jgi:exopolyphosphatase/guanosine-5'-triphosphate,3'-diphosphate pyrophosphatase